ncbi:unnamed protein product [Linum trigynum]|uniref:Reverse transcriptase Ty1/copia-type domain-containing protein n=1 Tax=Linum trigynum TaxID=586398 RepID=A0AAV2GN87_9ROSI
MFIRRVQGRIVIVLVYVDDIILTGPRLGDLESVKGFLKRDFKIKDLGSLKYFLGLEVTRNRSGISVSQRKYCMDLIAETGYLDAKSCKSPIDCKVKLSAGEGKLLENPGIYKRLVGRLHYLTVTRPDIAFPVQQLCQYEREPRDTHLQAAYRVIRYLKGAPGQGLHFKANSDLVLKAYSDADWAACPDTRRSISGYCTFLGSSLITWKAKKQTTVSRSSSEAEYRALAHLICEIQWLKGLLVELDVKVQTPVLVYCDNMSAIQIAENPVYHERTKHVEIYVHVTRERVKSGLINLKFVRSEEQLADLFTKGLSRFRLNYLLDKLDVLNVYAPTCGGVTRFKGLIDLNSEEEAAQISKGKQKMEVHMIEELWS